MTHQLVYTSAARLARPGASGYGTAALTARLPDGLQDRLERLSHYRHLGRGADPARNGNPVAYAHTAFALGPNTVHVLSRVADSGLDHTGKSNFLAHHLVPAADDRPAAGPARVLQELERLGRFRTGWKDGESSVLPADERLPAGDGKPRRCDLWKAATGDAGWAGVLAAAVAPAPPAYLIYRPGQDVLGLVAEALSLVPEADRWRVTFSTYYSGAGGEGCQWRCVPAGSPEAAAARPGVLRVDQPMPGKPPPGPLVEAARTGVLPAAAAAPSRPPAVLPPSARPPAARTGPPAAVADYPATVASSPFAVDVDEPPAGGRARPTATAGWGGVLRVLLGGVVGMLLAFLLSAGFGLFNKPSNAGSGGEVADPPKPPPNEGKNADRGGKAGGPATGPAARKEDPAPPALTAAEAEELAELKRKNEEIIGELDKARNGKKDAEEKAAKLQQALREAAKGGKGPAMVVAEPPLVLGPVVNPNDRALFWAEGPDGAEGRVMLLGMPERLDARYANPNFLVKVALRSDSARAEEAIIEVKSDGRVTLTGRIPPTYPLLGLAVVKVNRGDRPPVYRQLFRPVEIGQGLDAKPFGDNRHTSEFLADPAPQIGFHSTKLKQEYEEYRKLDKVDLRLGRTARVKVSDRGGDRVFDLEPPENAQPPYTRLVYRGPRTDPQVELTTHKDWKFVIKYVPVDDPKGKAKEEAKPPPKKDGKEPAKEEKGAKPPEVRVTALEVYRTVTDEPDGPTVVQELFRVRGGEGR